MKLTAVCLFLCLVAAVPSFGLEDEMSPEMEDLQESSVQADDTDKDGMVSQQEFPQTARVMGKSEHEDFEDLDEEKRGSYSGYRCPLSDGGRRIHEMTSRTRYDCRDSRGGNTCRGGQCVAYVTCRCRSRSTGRHPPNTRCWRPGTKVVNRGRCNRNIARGTAIATFTRGRYYGHAAVFVGCDNDYTIRTWDQWCCRSIGYSKFTRYHRYYDKYYVIERRGGCSDRRSWRCRSEAAGSNCCRSR